MEVSNFGQKQLGLQLSQSMVVWAAVQEAVVKATGAVAAGRLHGPAGSHGHNFETISGSQQRADSGIPQAAA
jgi:hypothetical protein